MIVDELYPGNNNEQVSMSTSSGRGTTGLASGARPGRTIACCMRPILLNREPVILSVAPGVRAGQEPGFELRGRGIDASRQHRSEESPVACGVRAQRGLVISHRRAREKIRWMRLEGQHRARRIKLGGETPGAIDDRAMAKMRAVEIADRQHRAFKPGGGRFRINRDHKFLGFDRLRHADSIS